MRLACVVLVVLTAAAAHAAEEPKRISLELEDVSLETVARTIARQASVVVEVAPSARSVPVTIRVEDATPEEILREAAKLAGVPFATLPDGSYLLGTMRCPTDEELRRALRTCVVSFNCETDGLPGVLALVSGQIGIPIVPDPAVAPEVKSVTVTLLVRDLPAESVLDLLCAYGGNLEHDVRWGTVVLTSPSERAKLPKRLLPSPEPEESKEDAHARSRLETTPVTFRVERMPLAEVLKLVSEQSSVPIGVAPAALEKIGEVKVTWEVQNAPARAVLALLLPRRGLRCRLEDGGLRVETTE